MTLFPYQLDGVRFLLEHPGALLADEMGLGKTVQAIGLVNADPNIRTVLVVCPATMKLVWKREFEKWLNRELKVVITERDLVLAPIVIINYDRLRQHWVISGKLRW